MADERRSARRAHIGGVRVTYESATGDRVETVAHDLARSGLFVRAAKPLAVGKRIALEIQVIGEQGTWSALGRVVWTRETPDGDRPAGMGVKLIDIEESVVAVIDRLVETRERTEPGVGVPSAPPAMDQRAPALSIPIDLVGRRRAATTTAGEATATTEAPAATDKRSGCGWSLAALGTLAALGAVGAYALALRAPTPPRPVPAPPLPMAATTPPPGVASADSGAPTSVRLESPAPSASTPTTAPLPPGKKLGSAVVPAVSGRPASTNKRTDNPY
jgi:uncharacterized protein (TIGR02266 family)